MAYQICIHTAHNRLDRTHFERGSAASAINQFHCNALRSQRNQILLLVVALINGMCDMKRTLTNSTSLVIDLDNSNVLLNSNR